MVSTHEFRRLEDFHIVCLDPGDLREFVLGLGDAETLEEEQGTESLVPVGRLDSQNGEAVGLDLLDLKSQGHLEKTENSLASARGMENFVHVRQRQRKTNVATIHTNEDNNAWIGNRLQVIRRMEQIFQSNRIETPIAVKALVIEAMDCLQFLVQVLHVDRADRNIVSFLKPVDDFGDAGGRFRMQRNIPSVERPDNAKSNRIVDLIVIRRIPRHRNEGGSVITLCQHAAIIIDRGVIGPPHDSQSLILQDLGSGIDQSPSHRGVVDKIEKSKEADRVLVVAVVGTVDDCRNAANGLPVAASDQGSDLPVFF